jgi:hypothetical protein
MSEYRHDHALYDRMHPYLPRRHPMQCHEHDRLHKAMDNWVPATRLVVLFDANGTLTQPSSVRRAGKSGEHVTRPGIEHLQRLRDAGVVLGVYSSAMAHTVRRALKIMPDVFEPRMVLHRSHTFLAPPVHLAAGGRPHDTVKPLRPYFRYLHRVILVDDSPHKPSPGEEHNAVLVPGWAGPGTEDDVLERLVEELLHIAQAVEAGGDVRAMTWDVTARLHDRSIEPESEPELDQPVDV